MVIEIRSYSALEQQYNKQYNNVQIFLRQKTTKIFKFCLLIAGRGALYVFYSL